MVSENVHCEIGVDDSPDRENMIGSVLAIVELDHEAVIVNTVVVSLTFLGRAASQQR
jgi:hypothetical protein